MNIAAHIASLLWKYPGEFENLSEIDVAEDTDTTAVIAYNIEDNVILYNPEGLDDVNAEGSLAFISKLISPEFNDGYIDRTPEDRHRWNMACHIYVMEQLKSIGEFVFHPGSDIGIIDDASGMTIDEIYAAVPEVDFSAFDEVEFDDCVEVE